MDIDMIREDSDVAPDEVRRASEDIPANLRDPAFLVVWEEWLSFRRENGWRCTATWQEHQLRMLSKYGGKAAGDALEMSMSQGVTEHKLED